MDEPSDWATRQPWRDRKRRELDNIVRASGSIARDLADKYQHLPVGSEKRSKVFRDHDDWVDGLYADVDRQEAAVQAFAKSRRIDPEAVMVGLYGDFAIAQETKRERAEARLSHRKAYAQRHGLVPPVRGAAAIEAAAADGEPARIEGVVRLPKADAPPVGDLKNYDVYYSNFAFNGQIDQLFVPMNLDILQGVGNGRRVGNKIRLCGFEFRYRMRNSKEKFEMQNTYGWAGYAPVLKTGRTVPAIQIPAGTRYCDYYASDDNVALRLINGLATSGGTVSTLLAETGVATETTDLWLS